VLAKFGVSVVMADLFGVEGNQMLDRLDLPAPYAARVASLRRVIEAVQLEIDLFARLVRGRLARDPGYVGRRPKRDVFAGVTGSKTAIERRGMRKLLEHAEPGDTVDSAYLIAANDHPRFSRLGGESRRRRRPARSRR